MTRRPAAPAAPSTRSAPAALPVCCGRPMSTISVTETVTETSAVGATTELTLLSCSSCSRHAWLQDGALLDRDGMLAAVRARLAEAPRPKGGRPKGSGRKSAAPAAPAARRVEDDSARRAREVRALLQGFTVHGS